VLHGSFCDRARRGREFQEEVPVREFTVVSAFGRRRFHVVSSARNVAVYPRLNPVLQDRAAARQSGSIEGAGLAFQATTDRVVERGAAGSQAMMASAIAAQVMWIGQPSARSIRR